MAIAILSLHAQQPPPRNSGASAKAETCSIAGRVVSGLRGEGVKKAEVTVFGRDNLRYTTTTRDGGGFAMQGIEPGRYHVQVTKRGFARFVYGARGTDLPGAMLSLDPGQHIDDLV